ncbi:MAG: YraN family protein [Bacteroidia bacterium]
MAAHNITGKQGEQLASSFLEAKEYEILEKNWHFKNAEIDIIARSKNVLIIAEVKTRSSNYFGEPETWVTREKQRLLIKAAAAYIEKNNLDIEVRFDIISVLMNGEQAKINHIESAFYALR